MPQCSILSLTLFLLYVNDLPIHIQESTVLFAADTFLTAKNVTILQQNIKRVIHKLQLAFHSNSVMTNTQMTIAMSFHTWQKKIPPKPHITFDSTAVT
jgi:hydroxyacyl-ACP dehydratase HTD2-like protein with hotdog domain